MSNLVSIIIPFYQKKMFFKNAIYSILKQTYRNYEIVLVYDDPNKQDLIFVKNILKKIKKKKIIVNKKNLGVGYSRNIGIKNCNGKFIAFLDADDIWHKNKLKIQLNFMLKKKCDFSFTAYKIIDEKNKKIQIINAKDTLTHKDLIVSCDIGLSTVILKSKILKNCKFPNLKTKEDYVLWLKLSKNIELKGINKILSYWRKTDNSLSSSTFQKIKDAFLVYYKYLHFNIFKSFFLVLNLSINFVKKRYL